MPFFDTSITLPCYFRCHRAGSQLKTIHLFPCWQLFCDPVFLQQSVPVGSEHGRGLSVRAVHIGGVNIGSDEVVLLPHALAAHRGRPDEVEAGGSEVHPGVERVALGDGDYETYGVILLAGTAVYFL